MKRLWTRILSVLIICVAVIGWAGWLTYRWKNAGTLISIKNASSDLIGIFVQNLLISAVTILFFLICMIVLRGKIWDELYLKVKGKKQWIIMVLLMLVFVGRAAYAMFMDGDVKTALYKVFYYLLIIAFEEEFVVRGLCTHILKDEKALIRYLIPNVMFALMHVFSFYGWGEVNAEQVLRFVTSQVSGYLIMGCFLLFLKEKSGTIWIPVMVHAILDY